MIEEFAKRSRLTRSSPIQKALAYPEHSSDQRTPYSSHNLRLRAIHSVESLVQKQPNRPTIVHPRRTILVERGVIPEQSQNVGHHKREAYESNHVWGHAHGETSNDNLGVEGLEDVLRKQGPVDAGILVLLEPWKLMLPDVDHRGEPLL